MSVQTDQSVSPYFDDYSEQKEYYKILFRPGVAVQTRELNQLQTMLQKQIEYFGDNILKSGTIVRGCDISFHDDLKYVKIKDAQTNSRQVNVEDFANYRVRNQNDILPLQASIIAVSEGYESQAPDLNTLFIRYLNSGYDSSNTGVSFTEFKPDETLTVYNPANVIEQVNITNPSSGFTSSDRVVFTSAIAIQNTTFGTAFANNFFVGDYISNGTANVQIISAPDTTTIPGSVVLRIKPRVEDLQSFDPTKWTFTSNTTIQSSNTAPSSIAIVTEVLGQGAQGSLNVTALGQANTISVISKGTGYRVAPHVSISSRTAPTSQINIFSAVAQTFLANITVAGTATSPVGSSYGITVSDGVIYQKGYFTRVKEHLLVVDKYSNLPDGKVVGFETLEATVSSLEDTSLLDNATGAPNETAPGADRLQLTPVLITLDKSVADQRDDFLYVAEFSNGLPYKQNRSTVYNIIGDEIARRNFETSGNYVLNQFQLNTKAENTLNLDVNTFKAIVDPGTAYISGKRVETNFNYETSVDKGTDTISGNVNLSLNYGNFVFVKELAGTFLFKEGTLVTLYNTSGNFLSNAVGTISSGSLGTAIGTARLRSLTHDSGIVGSPNCTYRMYLFDIKMNAGRNFRDVRSIFHSNAANGVCDIVTENGSAVLRDPNQSSLIFYAGQNAVKSANSISYVYRTIDTSLTMSSNGTITLTTGTGERFAYTGTLNTIQERNVIITPLANSTASSDLTGTISVTSGSKNILGNATLFTQELQPGDFVYYDSVYGQIDRVANNTVAFLVANAPATHSNMAFRRFFPQNVPISFDRTNRTMSTNAPDYNQLTINLGVALTGSTPVSVVYNVRSNPDAAVVTKTVNRNRYIRICAANNVGTTSGPWALGITDAIRLNKVVRGSNGTFTEAGGEDITSNFFIDHNQTEDYLGTSFLYRSPKSNITVNNGDWLLVSFDYLTTSSEGVKKPGGGTYVINDSLPLANAASSMHTLEIPEVYSSRGDYYDLRDSFDFRPQGNNTVTPTATAGSAPLNPLEATVVIKPGDKKFPAPDSELDANISYYLGRSDRVIVDSTNNITVLKGTPGTDQIPTQPDNSLTIGVLNVPAYPSLPYKLSQDLVSYIDTGVTNVKYSSKRTSGYSIKGVTSDSTRDSYQPRNFTMEEISKLERRISDLEYYVSLTLVEQMAMKRNIASSTDAAIDRYKFGFYVNSFEDYTNADISDPGYNASIVDGYLSPAVSEINLPARPTTTETALPFESVTFVSQTRATTAPTSVTPTSTTVQRITSSVHTQINRATRDYPPYIFDEFTYKLSETAGPVELYYNARDNYSAIEIYTSTDGVNYSNLLLNSAVALPVTNNDIRSKGLSLNGKFEHPGSMERKGFGPAGRWIEDHFKLLWNHNPELGRFIKVRVYKGRNHGAHGKEGTYAFKIYYPVDIEVDLNTVTPTTNYLLGYRGFWYWDYPWNWNWNGWNIR